MILKIAVPKRKRSVSRKKIVNYFFYKLSVKTLGLKNIKKIHMMNSAKFNLYLQKYNINFYYHDSSSFE